MGHPGDAAAGPEARPGPGGPHVLVIEDEPHIAEAMRYLLARGGFRVSTHDGAGDALEAVRRARPDLVVLDLMLPGVSGIEVLRGLRGEPSLGALPVLMLTARGQERDRAAAEQAGADRFMTKPFVNAELLAAVRGLLGEGRT
ncbi:MAG: response regulator transcription factor [Gemmobacter sp.]